MMVCAAAEGEVLGALTLATITGHWNMECDLVGKESEFMPEDETAWVLTGTNLLESAWTLL